ncbi:hypothetical protein EVAR_43106_1 [Eumeta japonica]|uniref:Uncharacterized protein n=1 Tax=Eumeta variegata TaxID=151549 RepID=A0A4C1YEK0_EUMVA|nr:hypothetical protein EVAR_43106_1 [Eumeta japonica]
MPILYTFDLDSDRTLFEPRPILDSNMSSALDPIPFSLSVLSNVEYVTRPVQVVCGRCLSSTRRHRPMERKKDCSFRALSRTLRLRRNATKVMLFHACSQR